MKRAEALEPKQESGTAVANLDFEEERRDGKAEIAELINVLEAILSVFWNMSECFEGLRLWEGNGTCNGKTHKNIEESGLDIGESEIGLSLGDGARV